MVVAVIVSNLVEVAGHPVAILRKCVDRHPIADGKITHVNVPKELQQE